MVENVKYETGTPAAADQAINCLIGLLRLHTAFRRGNARVNSRVGSLQIRNLQGARVEYHGAGIARGQQEQPIPHPVNGRGWRVSGLTGEHGDGIERQGLIGRPDFNDRWWDLRRMGHLQVGLGNGWARHG